MGKGCSRLAATFLLNLLADCDKLQVTTHPSLTLPRLGREPSRFLPQGWGRLGGGA